MICSVYAEMGQCKVIEPLISGLVSNPSVHPRCAVSFLESRINRLASLCRMPKPTPCLLEPVFHILR